MRKRLGKSCAISTRMTLWQPKKLPPRERSASGARKRAVGKHPDVGGRTPRFCVICGHRITRSDQWGRWICSIRCSKVFERKEKERLAHEWAHIPPIQTCVPYTPRERSIADMTSATKAATKLAKPDPTDPITPLRMQKMRSSIAKCVDEQIEVAHQQLTGLDENGDPLPKSQRWNAHQVRIFSILMNKVLPDLHASHIKRDPTKPVEEWTREELAKYLASRAKPDPTVSERITPDPNDPDIIDAEEVSDDPQSSS